MLLPFVKMHGLGNDYVYIDCFQPTMAELIAETDLCQLARRISDRHTGAGSDGLVLMMPSEVADIRMRMFNADGSEAEMCGNASRCIGKYAYEHGMCGTTMTLETLAGIKHITVHTQDRRVTDVTVEMGTSLGNPHEVFFFDTPEQLNSRFEAVRTAPEYASMRTRANIECAYVRNRKEITMRVCERGTGETMACGTGACATAVAAMERGLTDNEVRVCMPGGDVLVQRDKKGIIYLTGAAAMVYAGLYMPED